MHKVTINIKCCFYIFFRCNTIYVAYLPAWFRRRISCAANPLRVAHHPHDSEFLSETLGQSWQGIARSTSLWRINHSYLPDIGTRRNRYIRSKRTQRLIHQRRLQSFLLPAAGPLWSILPRWFRAYPPIVVDKHGGQQGKHGISPARHPKT